MPGFDISVPEPVTPIVEKAPEKIAEEQKKETDIKPAGSDRNAFKYNPDYHKMSDFLGLSIEDRADIETAEKIGFIRDYTGEKEEVDAMLKVKDMIKQLGVNIKGKELVKTLYQFARLAKERSKIDKEISLITQNEYKS